jgi:5-methyltetrahydrofolate--homocysteine methyltransferase
MKKGSDLNIENKDREGEKSTSWKSRLETKRVLIADGGWGSEFVQKGLGPGEAPEAWNLNRRDDVFAVASSYVQAGADIILTNTFGGTRMKLAKAGLESKTEGINRLGSEISKQAAGSRSLVFASMGPTGEFMKPLGIISEEEMIRDFAEQAKALAAGGADGIVIETMTDLFEAKAALRAVKENTNLPVAVTMTFDKGKRGYATIMGIRPEQAAQELEKSGADIVGANCGAGIDNMIDLMRGMRDAASLPIWCKPNAGLPEWVGGQTVYRETPEMMVSQLKTLLDAGANIVGGCCGTSPAHIRLFACERDRLFPQKP